MTKFIRPRDLNNAVPVPRVGRSRYSTKAAVVVVDGNVEAAIKEMRRQRDAYGLPRLLNRRSPLFGYTKPSAAKRQKSGRARARDRKVEAKRAARELRRDPHGKRPLPREEVIAAAA